MQLFVRERQMRLDAVFRRGQVIGQQCLIHGGRILPAIGQANAGAANQIFGVFTLHVFRQTLPQQHQYTAAAIIGMDAGASGFHHACAQVGQTADIEFVFGVHAAHLARPGWRQQAIGANHFQRLVITYQQMIAPLVKFIGIQSAAVFQRAQAQRLHEHAIAQTLCFAHLIGIFGQRHGQARCLQAVFTLSVGNQGIGNLHALSFSRKVRDGARLDL